MAIANLNSFVATGFLEPITVNFANSRSNLNATPSQVRPMAVDTNLGINLIKQALQWQEQASHTLYKDHIVATRPKLSLNYKDHIVATADPTTRDLDRNR